MAFTVEGDYFEVCSCDVSCPCIWLRPADRDACDVFLAFHIQRGSKDGVDLSGLNSVVAIHSPKQMTDGGWKVALYVDDRADSKQADAMGAIFSGQAGGYLAALGPLIAEATVSSAPITFERSNGSYRATAGRALEMGAEELKGLDEKTAPVISNPLLSAVPQPVRQGKATSARYDGDWSIKFDGTNSFITEFKYEG